MENPTDMGQRLDHAKALYLEAIGDGNPAEAIAKYSGARYTQHSTPVKDGQQGFVEFFVEFLERNPVREIEILRAFEDGPYVFLHVVQNLNNGEFRYVTADIFDTDDDAKLIEHWDIIAELRDTTASGRSQVDGPTEPTDLDKTEENKRLVTRFVTEVLATGAYDRLDEFIVTDTRYAQHNLDIPDGADSLREFGQSAELRYAELHNVIGCGNFVATLAESEFSGTRHAVIDLYRVEGGKLVEHWDVIEEITPRQTWVNSGKF